MIRVHNLSMETRPGMAKVTFYTEDINEVDQIRSKWRDKPLVADIKPEVQKRSLNSNAYLWKLCSSIADVLYTTKEEIYRSAIRQKGVFHEAKYKTSDIPEISRIWQSNGTGWFIDIVDRVGDETVLHMFHGSSIYDKKQMGVLIDWIVEEAKNIGVETMTPNQIEHMKSLWNGGV